MLFYKSTLLSVFLGATPPEILSQNIDRFACAPMRGSIVEGIDMLVQRVAKMELEQAEEGRRQQRLEQNSPQIQELGDVQIPLDAGNADMQSSGDDTTSVNAAELGPHTIIGGTPW